MIKRQRGREGEAIDVLIVHERVGEEKACKRQIWRLEGEDKGAVRIHVLMCWLMSTRHLKSHYVENA